MSLVILQREGHIDQEILLQAKRALEAGHLISFPTETVYALAASCTNAEAVSRIYAVKGRDASKPLALLIGSIEQARQIAEFDERAEKLAAHFFPGALTLVLKLKEDAPIATNINAGLQTIGVRIPNHPFALALLQMLSAPLVATSVNFSGQESAISVADIPEDFKEHLGLVVDGGAAMLGISSTVVDLSGDEITILRRGSVTEAQITDALQIKK